MPCTSCHRRWNVGAGLAVSHPGTLWRGSSGHWARRASFREVITFRLINPLVVQEASEQGKCSINNCHQICALSQSQVINGSRVFVPSIL